MKNTFSRAVARGPIAIALAAFVALVLATPASFGTTNYLVLPPAGVTQDGGGGADDFHAVMRIQECYGGSLFPQQPIVIRELRFRPSAAVGFAFSTTISNIQINLSTSSSDPESLSPIFAHNLGPDTATVFNGALPMSSAFTGPASGPKEFDMVVPFSNPFTFDPTKGNLIVEIINRSGSTAATYIDGWGANGDHCGRAWAYGVNPTNATYIDVGIEDVQIFYDPAPNSGARFDLSRDYSTNSNPNGPWSFGWKSALNSDLNLYTYHGFEPDGAGWWDWWLKPGGGASGVYHSVGPDTITNNGGQGVYPAGTVVVDGGYEGNSDNFCVVRLTIPSGADGQYRMDVAFHTHLDGSLSGDSDFHILRNGSEIYTQQVAPSSGGTVSQTVALSGGDTIDFASGRGADGQEHGSGLKLQAAFTLIETNPPPPATRYDLSQDFATNANPNGVWTYGYKSTLSGQLSILPRFIRLADPLTPNVPFDLWVPPSGGYPGVYHNGTTLTGHTDGGQGTYPPGVVWFYPGDDGSPNNFGVIRFTVPSSGDGNYRLISAVRSSLDGSSSGDTDFHVLVNSAEVFGQFLPGNSAVGYSNNLALAAGDTVDFAVGRGADGHLGGTGLKIQATLTLSTTNPPPPPPPCTEPAAGLVGWWPFENNFDDIAGGAATSAQGNPAFESGKVGSALSFDGTDSVTALANSALNVGLSDGMTIEGWIKPATVAYQQPLVEWNDAHGRIGAHLWISVGSGAQGSLFGNLVDTNGVSHQIFSPAGVIAINQFQHVALTFNRLTGATALYLNGSRIAQTNLGSFTPDTHGNLYFAWRPSGVAAGNRYTGTMDEISIYNRALSAEEIQSVFNADGSGKCNTPIAPQIVSQPQSQTVYEGESVTFSVQASGTPPLSYQWRFNGSEISGATASSLTLSNVQASDAGNYSVHVSNAAGSADSSDAVLTVLSRPPCAAPPAGLVGWWPGDGDANDALGANNGVALSGVTYVAGKVGQGFNFNGTSSSYVIISNSPALNLSNALTTEFWFLSRRWSPGGFGVFSKRAPSGVCNYGLNISEPYGFGLYYNDLSVSGVGDRGSDFEISTYFPLPSINVFHHLACTFNQIDDSHVHLETYLDGVLVTNKTIPGNLGRTLNTAPLIIGSTAGVVEYFDGIIDEFSLYNRALSAEEIQSIFTANASGKCNAPIAPQIVGHPQSQSVYENQSVTFSVQAIGTAPFSYQWRFNGSEISGATASSLTLSNVQASDAGNYSVHVSNSAGSADSSDAVLTVLSRPPCTTPPAGLVGWWPGDGDANDALGANNGVALSGVTYVAGKVGQGFNFNGTSSSYVIISNSPALNLSNALTTEFWFLSRRWSPGGFGVFSKRAPSGVCNYGLNISEPYGLGLYYNDLSVSGVGDRGSDFEISTYFPLPSINVFHHLACTFNQADDSHVHLETYLDGVLVTNKTIPGNLGRTLNTAPLIIGSTAGVVEYFDGIIDEFSLYNRALSAEEIQSIFNADAAGKCNTPVAPSIVSQPQSQNVLAGATVRLSVTASGTSPLSYQWFRNGEILDGTVNSSLVISNASTANNGDYRVIVSNAVGSTTSEVATVTVTVPRILEIGSVSGQQEGTRITLPVNLISEGDVGGATFRVLYNVDYLRDPELVWDSALDGSFNNVNTSTPGEVRATFALPATTLPAGTQTLAQISFFLRSVPQTLDTPLTLQISDMSGASGETLIGTIAHSATVTDRVRKITGDNNANDRLDVGDATVILRYLSALDPVRTWDVALNDLNQNSGLDSGDAIRVLRAASGIDPQPQVPGAATARFTVQSLSKAATAQPNAVITPSRIQTTPGASITVQVRLQNTSRPISGAAFKLHYDTNALRLTSSQSYHTGSLIPANALAVWNIAPAQSTLSSQNGNVSLAASSATAWPATDGVVAEFTFQVQPGAADQYIWPISLGSVETSEDGYVNHQWTSEGSLVSARAALPATLSVAGGLSEGRFTFTVSGDVGASYIVEASDDLIHWTTLTTISNGTASFPITDPDAANFAHRFYRLKSAQ